MNSRNRKILEPWTTEMCGVWVYVTRELSDSVGKIYGIYSLVFQCTYFYSNQIKYRLVSVVKLNCSESKLLFHYP